MSQAPDLAQALARTGGPYAIGVSFRGRSDVRRPAARHAGPWHSPSRSLSQQQDLADGLTGIQAVEAFVDVVECEGAAHQAVHRQQAPLVQRDVVRDVATGTEVPM